MGGLGVWDGEVVDVPSLKAPGFIQMRTYDRTKFSDVSSCSHLQLNVKTNTSYGGYKVSFGTSRGCPTQIFAFGYKAPFNIPVSDDFTSVNIPFTSFSDCWDDATGAIIKTCEEDKRYCPNSQTLENFGTMAIWGEGTDGVVHLQVNSIAAIGCSNEKGSVTLFSPSEESGNFSPSEYESGNLFSPNEESSTNPNDGTVVLESF